MAAVTRKDSQMARKDLTEREIEVLRMFGQGRDRLEVAKALDRSPKTIDHHRNALLQKLGLRNTNELALYAVKNGLVELSEIELTGRLNASS